MRSARSYRLILFFGVLVIAAIVTGAIVIVAIDRSTDRPRSVEQKSNLEQPSKLSLDSLVYIAAPKTGAGHLRLPDCYKLLLSEVEGSYAIPFKVGDLPDVVTFIPPDPIAVGWPQRFIVEHCSNPPTDTGKIAPASYFRTSEI